MIALTYRIGFRIEKHLFHNYVNTAGAVTLNRHGRDVAHADCMYGLV